MSSIHDLLHGQRTLVCLLQGMEGVATHVELRNETTIFGTIESVDAAMHITMSNVILKRPQVSTLVPLVAVLLCYFM